MAVVAGFRLRVHVRCGTCGMSMPVYFTARPADAQPGALMLQLVPDGDDMVMLGLMERTHRGPLYPVRG